MKAHAILSMLVVLGAAESATRDRFQRRCPTRLTVSRRQSAPLSRRSKAMQLSTRGKADTASGRVLLKSPARKKFRQSLHLHMSTMVYLGRDFCATGDRPVQVVSWKSLLRELQTKYKSMNSQSGSQKSEV